MEDLNSNVREQLDLVVPASAGEGDWDAVLRDASRPPPRRRWVLRAAAALTVAALGLFALVLASPFESERPAGVLERALAAMGDGPVLHVVLREGWGGTVVNLETGRRTRLHGEREVWYDPARGLHSISRFGGVAQYAQLHSPGEIPGHEAGTFGLLAEGYRSALESGRARNLGPDEVFGIPVYWLRVDGQWFPDSADDELKEWAHDVAVSRETYEPVAIRETLDGRLAPDGPDRILRLENLAAGGGDFTVEPRADVTRLQFRQGSDLMALDDAPEALGRTPFWLGATHEGLALTEVRRTTTRIIGERETVASGRRVESPDEQISVRLVYGLPGPGGVYAHGRGPYIAIEETTSPHRFFGRGAMGYFPPEGNVIVFGTGIAKLRKDGVSIALEASSEELLVAAARALEPMPSG